MSPSADHGLTSDHESLCGTDERLDLRLIYLHLAFVHKLYDAPQFGKLHICNRAQWHVLHIAARLVTGNTNWNMTLVIQCVI